MEEEASYTEARDATQDLLFSTEARIPSDILELIFEAGARIAQWDATPQPHPIEIVVSHVNRRWREIALNLASLWSSIFASAYDAIAKLETYLHRSKNHALRVCLLASTQYWRRDVLDVLRPHLPRFRRFHLVTDFVHPVPTVAAHFDGFDMPRLECLVYTPLDFGEFNIDTLDPVPFLPFTRPSPVLSSIRLNGPTMCLIRPPFSGIVQLCLSEERFPIPFRSICDTLQSCAVLVKLSFAGHTTHPHRRLATPLDVVHVVLPELRFLMLANGGNSDVLLSALSAPKLCSLRLTSFDDADLAYFLQLSQISKFPVLETLTLVEDTFSLADYRDMARVFPAIRTLKCSNSSYTDDVLEFLSGDLDGASTPWPTLGSLSFSQAQFTEKHQAMLCSLVDARIALRAPLVHLFLGTANRWLLDAERAVWLGERLKLEDGPEVPEDGEMRGLVEFAGDGFRC
ncbi:F-box domain-containing protein [Mycena kentingensis (nom. inval.)]|nr:F-box domain-containing protein [Mycena kentingensis (nom. inval.)]